MSERDDSGVANLPLATTQDATPEDIPSLPELDSLDTVTLDGEGEPSGERPLLEGRYRIIRQIGAGGMGVVYLGEHVRIGKLFAIKVLSRKIVQRAADVARFTREAKAASRIRHPNVVEITDFGETSDGRPFFVMEYLEGETLSATLQREQRLPWRRVRAIMKQILSALAAAHQNGIVHRDLKTDNCVCLSGEGRSSAIKLLDFGIAKFQHEQTSQPSLTRTGAAIGTPNYMSPEQIRGDELDHRSDLYSAGIVLFQLVTGELPFRDDNPILALSKRVSEAPRRPSDVDPEFHYLDAIVNKALARRREDRFQTALEFSNALEKVQADAPIATRARERPVALDEERAAVSASESQELSASHGELAPVDEPVSAYEVWVEDFLMQRIPFAFWFGISGFLIFAALDYVVYPAQAWTLVQIRLTVVVLLLALYVLHVSRYGRRTANFVMWLATSILGCSIATMTVFLGGFESRYYAGMNLILMGAPVLIPARISTHILTQATILIYYLVINLVWSPGPVDWRVAGENGFFLLWTCLVIDLAVWFQNQLQRAELNARAQLRSTLELNERERLRNEFYANINHELRTPLTLILGAFRQLGRDPQLAPWRGVVATGLRNTSRLLLLINKMLDLARFDSGRGVPEKRCVDIAQLVQWVASNFETSDSRRRINLRGVDQPLLVELDIQQIKMVFYNLLSNAFKFTDPARCQVWIRLRTRDAHVEIQVEDNGRGIPRGQLDRIFGRFEQIKLEDARAKIREGTGIGLALVREAVESHGGTITVESEVDQGTSFTITLPLGDTTKAPIDVVDGPEPFEMIDYLNRVAGATRQPAAVVAAPSPAAGGDAATLLVVEDNADLKEYLVQLLSPHFRVASANDGKQALEYLRDHEPDLVVTDDVMPRMSGRELLESIRADPVRSALPVIVLTAQAAQSARVSALDAGADDYLIKPFVEEELLARVRNLLRFRDQEREMRALNQRLKEQLDSKLIQHAAGGEIQRFLPRPLVEGVLEGAFKSRKKFERRRITILYAEVANFARLTEQLEPEELYELVNEYLHAMAEAVTGAGGVVDKVTSDGLQVLFGAVGETEIRAQVRGALRGALEMRERVAELGRSWRRRGVQALLSARVGVSTGYCTVGVFGSELIRRYTAIGRPVNVAPRLASAGEGEEILCAFSTYAIVEDEVEAEPLGSIALEGVGYSLEAYRLRSVTFPATPDAPARETR